MAKKDGQPGFFATVFGLIGDDRSDRRTSGKPQAKVSNPQADAAIARATATAAERNERRELLYGIVREAMVHAGVLSASYKFKVLTLDPDGYTHQIMVDIAEAYAMQPELLVDLEMQIMQRAKELANLRSQGIYWRCSKSLPSADVGGGRSPKDRPKLPMPRPAPRRSQQPVYGATGDDGLSPFALLSGPQGSGGTGYEDTAPVNGAPTALFPEPSPLLGSTQFGMR